MDAADGRSRAEEGGTRDGVYALRVELRSAAAIALARSASRAERESGRVHNDIRGSREQ